MTIYHLPQGQYRYTGHVINMPQDLSVFATSLPRLPSELDVMIVRKKGSNKTHRDFRVKRMVVQRALQWLKRNNKYYRNIDIDVSVLSQLPDDGDLTDKCGVGIEDNAEKQEEEEELPSEDTDPADVATFIPVVARKMTEKETIRKSVHHLSPTSAISHSGDVLQTSHDVRRRLGCEAPSLPILCSQLSAIKARSQKFSAAPRARTMNMIK